jgi:hypothetical protein
MSTWPHPGAEAAALELYVGRWIAQDGLTNAISGRG